MRVVLIGFLLLATEEDLRTYRVPNVLIVLGLVLGLVGSICTVGFSRIGFNLLQWILLTVSLMPLYALKAIGAGDVKIYSVICLFLGWKETYLILLASLFMGAVLGLIKVLILKIKTKNKEERKKDKGKLLYMCLKNRDFKGVIELIKNYQMTRIHFTIPILIGTALMYMEVI